MSLTDASAHEVASSAKSASHTLTSLPASARDSALELMHAALTAHRDEILAANARDMAAARQVAAEGGLSQSLVSRLDLGKAGKFEEMLRGILEVKGLEDPLGRVQLRTKLDDGLVMERVTCPIGVVLVIFEARPEVIANIASLALKSGNAAILKGGKESTESFLAISRAISSALAQSQVPPSAIQLVTTRDAVTQLLAQDRSIDLVIPRGSNELVRHVKSLTKIPVLGHADGLCAIYLAPSADPSGSADAVCDAKTSYPAACNSAETLLVHSAALASVLPVVAGRLLAAGVTLRCDPASRKALEGCCPEDMTRGLVQDASPEDYETEHLALVMAVKTVGSLDEAVAHINRHGSHHTDAIFTGDADEAERFMDRVDSAGVFWNAPTRMADGMRYGFGTEVGISTNKIHARGPVGLEGLTIYKYKIRGGYQATSAYGEGEGKRAWKHERML